MNTITPLQAMSAAANLPATARILSVFLAEHYDAELGYSAVHFTETAAIGVKERSFRLATNYLEEAKVWNVERHPEGRSSGNRYFPLFLPAEVEAGK